MSNKYDTILGEYRQYDPAGYTGTFLDGSGNTVNVTNGLVISITSAAVSYLLLEDGFYLLQENSDKIIL